MHTRRTSRRFRSPNATTLHVESLESRQLLTGTGTADEFAEDGGEPDGGGEGPVVAIVGGEITPDEWPMMVSLSNSAGHLCGATLVDFDVVVTAAHCLDDTPASGLRAIIGRSDLSTNRGESISISEAIVHPRYRKRAFDDDIAILMLSRPSIYEPVEVIHTETAHLASPGTNAIALGWGALDDSSDPAYPTKLHRVDVPIVSNSVANRPQGYNGQITSRMLAAGAPGKDTCGGDSGGPLFVKDSGGELYLAGITSFGSREGCGLVGLPGVYTRISSYDSWLDPYVPPPSSGRIGFNANEYKADQRAEVTLRDANLVGQATQSVTITSSLGDSESVMLSETVDGVFVGDIKLSLQDSTLANGTLEVSEKGTIEVSYEDQEFLDGLPSTITAIATIFGDDHGNSIAAATQLSTGSTVGGELEQSGDVDWFSLDLTAGVNYELETTLNTLDDTILTVFDSHGRDLLSNDDAGDTAASKVRWEPALSGTYFVEVKGYSDAKGSYTLTAEESETLDDHGNGPLSSTFMEIGENQGSIEFDVDRDWFKFDAVAGTEYSIEVETIGLADSYLRLIDADGFTQLEFSDDIPNGLSSRINWTSTASGTYFFEVTGWAGDRGSYGLKLSSAIHEDTFEPNDAENRATIWPIETALEDLSIHASDDVDWFRWIPAHADTYSLIVDSDQSVGGPHARVLDENGVVLAQSSNGPAGVMIRFEAAADQPIFVQVESPDGSTVGRYGLTISRTVEELDGDFNGDQRVDIDDVDRLCSEIRNQSTEQAFDVNQDNSIDHADLDFMLENVLGTVFGDVNGDGRFDSSDFVAIFSLAEYEDDIVGNSNWSSGDWNCDGEFDTKDFVVAFQRATYSSEMLAARRITIGEVWLDRDDRNEKLQ